MEKSRRSVIASEAKQSPEGKRGPGPGQECSASGGVHLRLVGDKPRHYGKG